MRTDGMLRDRSRTEAGLAIWNFGDLLESMERATPKRLFAVERMFRAANGKADCARATVHAVERIRA